MFFVDDGNISAPFDIMLRAIEFILAEGPRYGYVLKKNKGAYLLGKCADAVTALQRKEALVALGFEAGIIHIHPDNAPDAETTGNLAVEYGANILGSFIGDDLYIKKQLHRKAVEMTELGGQLVGLAHTQSVMLLFRYCYCPMINHLMRTISPRLLRFLTKQFDYCKREILASILDYKGENIPARVVYWSQFSISLGGLGLGFTRLNKHAAFAASFSTTRATIAQHVPDVMELLATGTLPYLADINDTLAFICTTGGYPARADLDHQMFSHAGNCPKLQETLAHKMLQRIHGIKLASTALTINEKAWITSTSQYEASLWLEALPKTADLTMTNQEFRSALYYRNLLPQPVIQDGIRCNCANRPTLDVLGHHAITGCKCGGGRQNTHDSVKHTTSAMLRYAGMRSREEQIGIFQMALPACNKRADITVDRGPLSAQDTVLDISVTCPLPGAAGNGAAGLDRHAAGIKGRAANLASQRKIGKYGNIAAANQLNFVPIIFESPGYVHDLACAMYDRIAAQASAIKIIPKEVIYKYWMKRISVTLQKALVTALYRRIITITSKRYGVNQMGDDEQVVELEVAHIHNDML
jgi:hypothetical protein